MLKEFTEALALLNAFNKKHLLILIVMIVIVFVSIILYEHYTSYFRFSRLEKATALLQKLYDIGQKIEGDEKLKEIHQKIVNSLADVLEIEKPNISKRSLFYKWTLGFILWFIWGVFALQSIKKGKGNINEVYGVWILGAISASIGTLLPEYGWPWFQSIVYPFLTLIAFAAIILAITKIKNTSQKSTLKNNNQ